MNVVVILVVVIIKFGNPRVCGDINVRNNIQDSKKYTDCHIVDGFVKITLLKTNSNTLYFPNLAEITGYLLIYRANSIHSLNHVFPKLSVIRGRLLFYNYALVIYEVPHILELGLNYLMYIERGAVRIEKNPSLCYLNTIDWSFILNKKNSLNIISSNKPVDECIDECPRKCFYNSLNFDHCLSDQHCQRSCSSFCTNKNLYCLQNETHEKNQICCHPSCLVGCYGLTNYDCFTCKNYYYNGACVDQCPNDLFILNHHRCITKKDCLEFNKSNKIYLNLCVQKCPTNSTISIDEPNICVECKESCPVVCPFAFITSIESAQAFKSCSIIDGALIISVKGGNYIANELTKNLGEIREVRDYVVIKQSYSLLSLNFLKKLEIIHGNQLLNGKYAFVVRDNNNLQEIWSTKYRNPLIIGGHGLFYFYGNRHLCPTIIMDFIASCNFLYRNKSDILSLHSGTEVSLTENGDKMACNILKIETRFTVISHNSVLIRWKRVEIEDYRQLISYQIFYRESVSRNISIFESRDVCDSNVWHNREVFVEHTQKNIGQFLSNLNPWTQYVYYIQTNILSLSQQRGLSDLMFFKTHSDYPSSPRFPKIIYIGTNYIKIKWQPPLLKNGELTNYILKVGRIYENLALYDQRNYCINKLIFISEKSIDSYINETFNPYEICKKYRDKFNTHAPPEIDEFPTNLIENKYQKIDSNVRESQILFEDYIQSNIFLKRPNVNNYLSKKFTRSLVHSNDTSPLNSNTDSEKVTTINLDHNFNNFSISSLNYFTPYKIEIFACNQNHENIKLCSVEPAIIFFRTRPSHFADTLNISLLHTFNVSHRSFWLKWRLPLKPNSRILSHEIEIHRLQHNVKPDIICIPDIMYRKNNGTIQISELSHGNYSYKVRVISLAGNGSWTPKSYIFIYKPSISFSYTTIVGITLTVIVLFIIFICCISMLILKHRLRKALPEHIIYTSTNPEYFSTSKMYVPDEWEVDIQFVSYHKQLGKGTFGMVYSGMASHLKGYGEQNVKCAVKTVNKGASIQDKILFLKEATLMKEFNCSHVVKLLGIVSKTEPTLVLMELMGLGDLKTYMRKRRPENNFGPMPTLDEIANFLVDIADGMVYLGHKKFVHRDLAARNCLVNYDNIAKIGDFGLTRDIYESDYYRKDGKSILPVRWMSPESLRDGIFTCSSDVWSFGILTWELVTMVEQPYQGLGNEQVLKYVVSGKIMEKPYFCPDFLYAIMESCWMFHPNARMKFEDIIKSLESYTKDPDFKNRAYIYSDEYKNYINVTNVKSCTFKQDLLEDSIKDLNDEFHKQFVDFSNQEDVSNSDSDIEISEKIIKKKRNKVISNSSTLDLYLTLNNTNSKNMEKSIEFEPLNTIRNHVNFSNIIDQCDNFSIPVKQEIEKSSSVNTEFMDYHQTNNMAKYRRFLRNLFRRTKKSLPVNGKKNSCKPIKSILLNPLNSNISKTSGFVSDNDIS